MSMTLNFVDQLFCSARNLRDLGQNKAAERLFRHLAGCRDLDPGLTEEAHASLAAIELEHDRYKLARRHLAAALARQPDCAHYHYLLAIAVEDDPVSDPKRAAVHYRRSLALDPTNFECLCDFGLFSLRQGQTRTGLSALRRAAKLTDDQPDALGRVVAGLREADKPDEAKELLRTALFRHPRDHRFRQLWNGHQFNMLHAAQDEARQRFTTKDDDPVILPFRRPKKRVQRVGNKTIRIDGPVELKGPTILPLHVKRKKDA